jgi:hypothetical protein
MSSDLLLNHLKTVKNSISPKSEDGASSKRKRSGTHEESADYARQARAYISQKKSRIDHLVKITTLAQPAKKNRKKLNKLIKLAKTVSKS